MLTPTILFVAIHVLSLMAMAALILEYRHIQKKHFGLLSAFGSSILPGEIKRHRRLVITYVITTVAILLISSILFFFQPHIL